MIATGLVTPDANGDWSWKDDSNTRVDGNYTLVATIVDKNGNRVNTGADGSSSQIITIDTSATQNTDPSNPSNAAADDPNRNATLTIKSIDDSNASTDKINGSKDTGISDKDFYTADNTLMYFGTVTKFTANGDALKLELKDSYGKIIRTDYLTPDANGNWSWNDQNNTRADGNYTLQASIVDKAGNLVNSGTSQIITIDTSSSLNTDPSDPAKQPAPDPNSRFVLDISGMKNDSGVPGDWITNDAKPVFSGSFRNYAFDSTQGQISFQLLDSTG